MGVKREARGDDVFRRVFSGRWPIYLLLLAGLGISLLPVGTSSTRRGGSVLLPTGYRVEGRFLEVWRGEHSYQESVAINGFPISDKHPEASDVDGQTYMVQWFERARFEEHPEQEPPNDVQLSLLGTIAARGRQGEPAFRSVPTPDDLGPNLVWFPETGHTLRGPFLEFFDRFGRVGQFGFPISEQFEEQRGEGGSMIPVQYFERARFELHTGADGRQVVSLGLLGVEQYVAPTASPANPTVSP